MKSSIDFKNGEISTLLFKLSIPAFLGIVINLLYGFVDGIFIGQGVGSTAFGGVTVVFPITLIVVSFASMIGEGLASILARVITSKNKEKAILIIKNAQSITIITLVTLSIVSLINVDKMMLLLGANGGILDYAVTYYKILAVGIPFMGLSLVYFHQLNAQGEIRIATKGMLFSSIINIILDYVFIFRLDLGIAGAAYATVIAQIIWYFYMHLMSIKNNDVLTITIPIMIKFDFKIILEIMTLGFGSFVRKIGVSISMILINKFASLYGGEVFIASFGVSQRILRLFIAPIAAISTAFKPIVGQNFGCEQYGRIEETTKMSLVYSIAIGTILMTIIVTLRNQLGLLFGINQDELWIFNRILLITTAILPLYGVHHIAVNYFIAIGKAKPAIVLNLLRQFIILVPLILILPKLVGRYGVFLALPFADVLSIIIASMLLRIDVRKIRSYEKSDLEVD